MQKSLHLFFKEIYSGIEQQSKQAELQKILNAGFRAQHFAAFGGNKPLCLTSASSITGKQMLPIFCSEEWNRT